MDEKYAHIVWVLRNGPATAWSFAALRGHFKLERHMAKQYFGMLLAEGVLTQQPDPAGAHRVRGWVGTPAPTRF